MASSCVMSAKSWRRCCSVSSTRVRASSETLGHAVEALGQPSDLVAARVPDPHREVALGHAGGQHLHRPQPADQHAHHAAGRRRRRRSGRWAGRAARCADSKKRGPPCGQSGRTTTTSPSRSAPRITGSAHDHVLPLAWPRPRARPPGGRSGGAPLSTRSRKRAAVGRVGAPPAHPVAVADDARGRARGSRGAARPAAWSSAGRPRAGCGRDLGREPRGAPAPRASAPRAPRAGAAPRPRPATWTSVPTTTASRNRPEMVQNRLRPARSGPHDAGSVKR